MANLPSQNDPRLEDHWASALKRAFSRPAVLLLGCLGFSAGLPYLLIFSSLSVWLKEVGIASANITYFSWAVLAFSLKFSWAPLVDRLPIPVLTKLVGRRRSWLLATQSAIIFSIALMALNNPAHGLALTIVGCLLLSISAATQDVALDAYRIEVAPDEEQGLLASSYILGYRIAMLASGAGALFLAQSYGSTAEVYSYEAWRATYLSFIPLALIGPITTFLAKEPPSVQEKNAAFSQIDYLSFFLCNLCLLAALLSLCVIAYRSASDALESVSAVVSGSLLLAALVLLAGAAFAVMLLLNRLLAERGVINQELLNTAYVEPFNDFFLRHGRTALLFLILVALFRMSDVFIGVIANLFYIDLGYSKSQIGAISKTFGLVMTIVGSFAGGILALKIGNLRVLLVGGILAALTNLGFIMLHHSSANWFGLATLISFDNFSAGLSMAAFIAWMSSLTSRNHTAVQYALLASLMTLLPKFFAGFSGDIVAAFGYDVFFGITILAGLPCIAIIIHLLNRDAKIEGAPAEA